MRDDLYLWEIWTTIRAFGRTLKKAKKPPIEIAKAYYLKVQNQMSTSHEKLDYVLNKEDIAKEFAIADKEDGKLFIKLATTRSIQKR